MSTLQLDLKHATFDPMEYPLSKEVRQRKYSNNGKDVSAAGTIHRVASSIGKDQTQALEFEEVIELGLFVPAGRIMAGAGTGNRVTLVNCFVNQTVPDSMEGIMNALGRTALTMQQGGGMGTDFSTLRPSGAHLSRTNSVASGPLPFMDTWNAMCLTIMSAGSRRGAMMGTMICSHPDLLDFIKAKQQPGRMANFNVSILITNAFMEAVKEDKVWPLQFAAKPHGNSRPTDLTMHDYVNDAGQTVYTYAVHKARDLWDEILKATYAFAEPGVIFIDRVNELNNLNYCETISCTNPCGEQPLPPDGACNLGAINLARIIKNPFRSDAYVDWVLLKEVTRRAIIFLDRVIDVTEYPLAEQQTEQINKRRIGLGIMGLADALIQLGLDYGSEEGRAWAAQAMSVITNQAYLTSSHLARAYGTFPLYDEDAILNTPLVKKLDVKVQKAIKESGLRNGVLLTIAPTGTTALAFGNYSSGLEPNFRFINMRNVRVPGDTTGDKYEQHVSESFIKRFADFCNVGAQDRDPKVWRTADDLSVEEHVKMQATLQQWVDASISKTINCPKDMTFEEFKGVYQMAWDLGCKGCTTYRPSDVRGAILVEMPAETPPASPEAVTTTAAVSPAEGALVLQSARNPRERPAKLRGETVKLKWPGFSSAIYMTLNKTPDGKPFEVFFNSKDSSYLDWMTALSLALTALLRHDVNPDFILTEYRQISAAGGSRWIDGVRYDSFLALAGTKLDEMIKSAEMPQHRLVEPPELGMIALEGPKCPECGIGHMIMQSGCPICDSCGHSKC